MKAIQIKDSTKSNNQNVEEKQDDIVVGIDLGTTNSVIAYYKNDKIEIVKFQSQKTTFPSVLYINKNIKIAGQKALSVLENNLGNIISSSKRLMGKGFSDVEGKIEDFPFNIVKDKSSDLIKIESNGFSVTPEEVAAEILKSMKEEAESYSGLKIKKAVITVPAYFDENARVATKNAAKIAGIEVIRLINEPTASAFAYGLEEALEGNYIVYDLGGGTFDISILKLEKGIFKVLVTSGDVNLGGDDIDLEIYKLILKKLNITGALEVNIKAQVLILARKIKEELSKEDKVGKEFNILGKKYFCELERKELEEIAKPLIEKTLNICKNALKDVPNLDVKGVILVGGSTRLLLLQKMVEDFFKIKPLCSINPDEVVAIGAAYQAANLAGYTKKSLLIDVIPLSLGLEVYGGLCEKIVHRNSSIPLIKAEEFTTYEDNQITMLINVVQGEREFAKDNRSIGQFIFKGIPKMLAGTARILVSFKIDSDGLLTVSAEEKNTKIKQEIEVKPAFGLDIETMKAMVFDGLLNSKADIENRVLEELKIEAKILINTIKSALNKDGKEYLTKEAIEDIFNKCIYLEELTNKENTEELKEEIRKEIKNLDKITEDFANKRMQSATNKILKSKNINDIIL